MSQIHVEASAEIDAPPEEVYAVFVDYPGGHNAILPRPTFEDMIIEKGGHGAGTVIKVTTNAFGIRKVYRMTVREPEPGRKLVEEDPEAGVLTTFTIEPLDGGTRSRVTIATDSEASPGFRGFMERLLQPPFGRRLYQQELQNLAAYLAKRHVRQPATA